MAMQPADSALSPGRVPGAPDALCVRFSVEHQQTTEESLISKDSMMVVKKSAKPRGRPPGDPDDLRTERLAIRMHPDLVFELNVLARLEGVTRSVLVERLLIRLVNDHYHRTIVDQVGRYLDGPPDVSEPRGVEYLRRSSAPKVKLRRPPAAK
jgi:hypothetical protein